MSLGRGLRKTDLCLMYVCHSLATDNWRRKTKSEENLIEGKNSVFFKYEVRTISTLAHPQPGSGQASATENSPSVDEKFQGESNLGKSKF